MVEVLEELEAYATKYFDDPGKEGVVEWAERCVQIPQLESEYHGNYSTALTPWVRQILELWKPGACKDLTMICGTQVSKTTVLMIGAMYRAATTRSRILWIMDTLDNARIFSETRWVPTIEESPYTKTLVPDDSDRFKKTEQYLGGSWIRFVGSNSPGNLASTPADVVIGDEIGKWPSASRSKNGVSAVTDARERMKSKSTVFFPKATTPTDKHGDGWKDFLMGNQCHYYVPCPACSVHQKIEMENIKWDPAAKVDGKWDYELVRKSAYAECSECGHHITDKDKMEMNRKGEWRPENPNAPEGYWSFRLPSWYSPWVKTGYGYTAVEFLMHKEKGELKAFRNNWEALPDLDESEGHEAHRLANRREFINWPKEVPAKVLMTVAAVDVQDDRLEATIEGWGAGRENWTLEHVIFDGSPGRPAVWDDLAHWLFSSRALDWRRCMIDGGGHYTQETYAFVHKYRMRGLMIYRGRPSYDGIGVIHRRSFVGRQKVPQIMVNTPVVKEWIYGSYKITEEGPGYRHYADTLDEEYFEQATAEVRRTKLSKGSYVQVWEKKTPGTRNEALDLAVMSYAGLHTFPMDELERLEKARLARDGKETRPKRQREKRRPLKGFASNW